MPHGGTFNPRSKNNVIIAIANPNELWSTGAHWSWKQFWVKSSPSQTSRPWKRWIQSGLRRCGTPAEVTTFTLYVVLLSNLTWQLITSRLICRIASSDIFCIHLYHANCRKQEQLRCLGFSACPNTSCMWNRNRMAGAWSSPVFQHVPAPYNSLVASWWRLERSWLFLAPGLHAGHLSYSRGASWCSLHCFNDFGNIFGKRMKTGKHLLHLIHGTERNTVAVIYIII